VFYTDLLAGLHDRLIPRTYVEIGVRDGQSLSVSRCPSIGIDPAFEVTREQLAPVRLLRTSSDEYFGRLEEAGQAPFPDVPVDFAFIDGMHQFEFVLRDFRSLERHAGPCSVIAIDDVSPRNSKEASRIADPVPGPWTGDVFRIAAALRTYRPDLTQILVDTDPTGTLLVTHLDPGNRVLIDAYDEIVNAFVVPDPQSVPEEVLARDGAIAGEDALALPLWDQLRAARV